ncbi:DUF397 domain-containing protein [Streptomyces sp. NPDC050636]|uniref:DUF397 domain-containing protein n=1 Tax=Streptomyces sp. NPDC050636 TaxID=3154510 RepID=UPI0034173204
MWRKSSYCGSNEGSCVEVADNYPAVISVRDSKDPHGSALLIPDRAWTTFITSVKAGDFPASD